MASVGSDVVESFIDVSNDKSGSVYKLGQIDYYKSHNKKGTCVHSTSDSSWVSQIGLCVLIGGGIGLYAKFWGGAEIAYVFKDDDDAITVYEAWKRARSKGKYINKQGLVDQDYKVVSLGGFSAGQVKRSPSARTRKKRAGAHSTNTGRFTPGKKKK